MYRVHERINSIYEAATSPEEVQIHRTKELARNLGITIGLIAEVTDQHRQENKMRQPGSEVLPEGTAEAQGKILDAVINRQRERTHAMGYPVDERGLIEIAPPEYGAAHEITTAIRSATEIARSTMMVSLNPEQRRLMEKSGPVATEVFSSKNTPYAYDIESSIFATLGVSQAELEDERNVVALEDGSFRTRIEADGVIVERTTHLTAEGEYESSSVSILPRVYEDER